MLELEQQLAAVPAAGPRMKPAVVAWLAAEVEVADIVVAVGEGGMPVALPVWLVGRMAAQVSVGALRVDSQQPASGRYVGHWEKDRWLEHSRLALTSGDSSSSGDQLYITYRQFPCRHTSFS